MTADKVKKPEQVNLGAGMEITIREIVEKMKQVSGFEDEIAWDTSKPDGQSRRCLNVSKAKDLFEFSSQVGFQKCLEMTYE